MVSCCSYKTARRGLLAVNSLNFIFGLAFIGVGSVSIQKAANLKVQFDNFCNDQCIAAKNNYGVEGCDCGSSRTTLGFEMFSAPGAGLVSVGVFSFLTACLGIMSAVRGTSCCLISYVLIVIFIIVLQFAFGIAAAALGAPQSINTFGILLERGRDVIDWTDFGPIMPRACTQAMSTTKQTSQEGNPVTLQVYHPACTFDGYCETDVTITTNADEQARTGAQCCQSCKFNPDGSVQGTRCKCRDYKESNSLSHCMTGEQCLQDAFENIGGPVAGIALGTLVLEIIAVCWAFVVVRQIKSKPDSSAGDVPMDEI